MSQPVPGRPRTWVLWVVRVALALTVLTLCAGSIASIWLGQNTGTFWWLILALPQVSIALIAVLICWWPDSRPLGLDLNIGGLLGFGLIPAVGFLKWQPILIAAVTIVAFFVRPRGKLFIQANPPPAGWPRI